jgi:hypothetical protein
MPLVPSFHAYAPKADLAQAYLGGQRIAQEAAADAARISLGYAGLQQRAVEAQMEAQAREKAIQAQSMRAMQENEFQKAYHDAQLGIAERRLQNEEVVAAMRLNQVKTSFEQQQLFNRLREQKKAAGMTEPKASQEAFIEAGGPGTTGFSSALFQNENAPRKYSAVAGQDLLGTPTRLPMTGPEFQAFMQTAPPQLQTNTVNQAISGMLAPPAALTNAPTTKRLRYNPKTGEFE